MLVCFNYQPLQTKNMSSSSSSFHLLSNSTTPTKIIPRTHQSSLYFLTIPHLYSPKYSNFSLKLNKVPSFPKLYSKFKPKASMAEVKSSNVNVYESEEQVAVELAKYTANLSHKFVSGRGAFSVVLSGGSLIKFLRKLVEPPYLDTIDWSKWHVFWVDERVVPKDHPDSNYKLAYDGFLSKEQAFLKWCMDHILSVVQYYKNGQPGTQCIPASEGPGKSPTIKV